jgi:hypothetical protein
MVRHRVWLSRFVGVPGLFALSLLFLGAGWPIPMARSIRCRSSAIASLDASSTQWQATLQSLESNLVSQGQSTLANQVQSVLYGFNPNLNNISVAVVELAWTDAARAPSALTFQIPNVST